MKKKKRINYAPNPYVKEQVELRGMFSLLADEILENPDALPDIIDRYVGDFWDFFDRVHKRENIKRGLDRLQ